MEEAVAVTFFFGLAIPRDTDNRLRQDLAKTGSIRHSPSYYILISPSILPFETEYDGDNITSESAGLILLKTCCDDLIASRRLILETEHHR
jgi:hypothetical protein